MLLKCKAVALQFSYVAQPSLSFDSQLIGRQIWVLGTQAINCNSKCVQCRAVDIRVSESTNDVEGIHSTDGNYFDITVSCPGFGEECVGDCSECTSNERFVEIGRFVFACFPGFPPTKKIFFIGERFVRMCLEYSYSFPLRPTTCIALGTDTLRPGWAVLVHGWYT
ncbi:hypothetical protein FDG2_0188 [Candidatus Protofrankia californiensis]|uniref:Uncharacterized protein n=1 Tax=Candidatus Protofrankia californiensis TaxID=1839754 RepID=A0A1C3NT48_9ACTN|nr:hypothetical protein FDG2_0188 [Candidatus Protofrankia californiensis]